jgi:hypothetical protein
MQWAVLESVDCLNCLNALNSDHLPIFTGGSVAADQQLHLDNSAAPGANQQPPPGHFSYEVGREPGSIPFNCIINLSEEPIELIVVPESHIMMEDYQRQMEASSEVSESGRWEASVGVDAVLAAQWKGKLEKVRVILLPGCAILFHGLLFHAGAAGTKGKAAMRLFINFQHQFGPPYDSDYRNTYVAKYCAPEYCTDEIAKLIDGLF